MLPMGEFGRPFRAPGTRRGVAFCSLLVGALLAIGGSAGGQSQTGVSEPTFRGLTFRNIGPATTSGRIDDFAVLESDPAVFYVATATGGLWKTVNNGTTWEVLFDDQDDVVSIGDVAIAPNDASLVWVGTGENNNRQSSSWGNGVYRSTDGGRTWRHMGLTDTKHIGRIVIDPVDTNVVYVAAAGHLWGPNKERGVFKTTDGGLTWTNVLFVNEDTGATELTMDPSNNKVLYAAAYQRRRAAWGFNGGGPGSAIYKSTDAGKSWQKLTNGIPEGPLGRIGLDLYRKNPNVVYATIELETQSGIYRSDDGGASWQKMSDVNPRPMYFSQIRIDPNDDHRIYVLGNQLYISDDGGRTFTTNISMHPDHHAMWINPANPNHLITGTDGGVGISYDRGQAWDFIDNMDLGQFYHVGYDMDIPYRVYGGLQDNEVFGGPSAVRSLVGHWHGYGEGPQHRSGIANHDWFLIARGDGFVAIADPSDSRTLYAEMQDGYITRVDRLSGERKVIRPESAKGEPAPRWNWNTPLVMSPHDSSTIFAAANRVFTSTARGHSWKAISSDLTTAVDRETLPLMGVTAKDFKLSKHDGVSAYGTLVAFAESPKKAGLYYAGADDGTVHVSKDDGKSWTNISNRFPGLPQNTYVSRLAPSAFDEGTVYATFDGHRSADYNTYVYMSTDYGSTWKSIGSNIPKGHTVHCVTEDLKNPNVLYVGTEFGLFVSLDKGGCWTRLRCGLPTVPISEITLHPRDNDMILATHGRSIWILDDVTPIQQAAEATKSDAYLFDVRPATQFNPPSDRITEGDRRFWGKNPEFGAAISYYLKQDQKDVKIRVRDAAGGLVREIGHDELKDSGTPGINRVYWDLRHQPLPAPRGLRPGGFYGFFGSVLNGPFVLPGEYKVTLAVDGKDVATRSVRVDGDPIMQVSDADRKTLHDTALGLQEMLKTTNEAADAVTALGEQMNVVQEMMKRVDNPPAGVTSAVEDLAKRIARLRSRLGPAQQPRRFGGSQDLRAQIGGLKGQITDSTSLPTEIQMRAMREHREDLAKVIGEINGLISSGVPALYKMLADHNIRPAPLSPIKAIVPISWKGN